MEHCSVAKMTYIGQMMPYVGLKFAYSCIVELLPIEKQFCSP